MVAPKITLEDIQDAIVSEYYFTAAQGVFGNAGINVDEDSSLRLLTFCVLVLKNGFTVTGESACAHPRNYDEELGESLARKNAEQKIWPLLGYELKSKIHKYR